MTAPTNNCFVSHKMPTYSWHQICNVCNCHFPDGNVMSRDIGIQFFKNSVPGNKEANRWVISGDIKWQIAINILKAIETTKCQSLNLENDLEILVSNSHIGP